RGSHRSLSRTSIGVADVRSLRGEVYPEDGNPAPAGLTSGILSTPDGLALRYARVPATGRPLKGTVIVLPGRNECIEKYFETFSELAARGFGSAMLDWRGQGGSARTLKDVQRGH